MITLQEFILDFAKNHRITHNDDFKGGTIEKVIKKDIYLINNNGVTIK